jgi:hypothetical protein
MEIPKYLFKSRVPRLTVTLPKVLVQFRNHTYGTDSDIVAEQLRKCRNVYEIPSKGPVEVEPPPAAAMVSGRATTANVGTVPPQPQRGKVGRGNQSGRKKK